MPNTSTAMSLDFTPGQLFASFLIGTIGFGVLMYGRKQGRMPQLVVGVAMCGYPAFVTSVGWMIAIFVALVVGLVAAVRAGY